MFLLNVAVSKNSDVKLGFSQKFYVVLTVLIRLQADAVLEEGMRLFNSRGPRS